MPALYCRRCGKPQWVVHRIQACEGCGALWFGTEPINVRQKPFAVTEDDRRFLRSLRISTDEEEQTQ